ncbi:MAG: D-alanyl-D-alanine carboxypeptidase/D-alanyl-D-alanine-endopeptidase [Ignavibacteriaceae bacterium]|nr:D-alanyl-D-alanine carboxypeptidase/D-alanyl-D-alanine-endopeptidase [Ignavibacteriaceae bacterium]
MLYKIFSVIVFIVFSNFNLTAQIDKLDSLPNYSYSTLNDFGKQMDDIFNDPNFSNAHWGVVIQSLETGEYFYKRNENKLFMPASNLKLFTSSAGLVLLGDDYRFTTNIYKRGKMDGSTLIGDIVVQGMGDPAISGRYHENDVLKIFSNWADSLLELGIDEITGNIIGDDNAFDEKGLGEGWEWDYESYWYAAQSSAISFNDNCIEITIAPDIKNGGVKIDVNPDTKYAVLVNKVSLVNDDSTTSIDIYRERGTNIITVFGTIRKSDTQKKIFATVNNPTQYSMVVLKEVLESKGIVVGGFSIDIDDLSAPIENDELTFLFSHKSPELKEIIKIINKNSQNFFAEQLMKTIGLEKKGFGSIENGLEACNAIFQEMGINPDNMIILDGSGLSRSNLVTPKQIVSLLNFMYQHKYYLPFYNSLPIAGVDGTLANRMKGSKAENNVRAKTGFIGGVRSLSGYVNTGDNEPIVFSMIVNNFTVPLKLAENIQDLVCIRLANFKRK